MRKKAFLGIIICTIIIVSSVVAWNFRDFIMHSLSGLLPIDFLSQAPKSEGEAPKNEAPEGEIPEGRPPQGEGIDRIETIGGKYETQIIYWERAGATIEYKENGNTRTGFFWVDARNALDWIKNNTPKNSIFLCWWTYGHMIKGYTEREVIAKNPSKALIEILELEVISNPPYLDSNETVKDITIALTTLDPNVTLQIMQKYGASYVFIYKKIEFETRYDAQGAHYIFKAAGLNSTQYLLEEDRGGYVVVFGFTELGKQTMIAKLLNNIEIEGLSLVYSDEFVNIYQIKQ